MFRSVTTAGYLILVFSANLILAYQPEPCGMTCCDLQVRVEQADPKGCEKSAQLCTSSTSFNPVAIKSIAQQDAFRNASLQTCYGWADGSRSVHLSKDYQLAATPPPSHLTPLRI